MHFYLRMRTYPIGAYDKNNIRFICLQKNTANRIDLKLSDPLKRIFSETAELKELPHMPTIKATKEEMMKDIRKKLSKITNAVIQRGAAVSHSNGDRIYTSNNQTPIFG